MTTLILKNKLKLLSILLFIISFISLSNAIESTIEAKENVFTKEFIESTIPKSPSMSYFDRKKIIDVKYQKTLEVVTNAKKRAIIWGVLFVFSLFGGVYCLGKSDVPSYY